MMGFKASSIPKPGVGFIHEGCGDFCPQGCSEPVYPWTEADRVARDQDDQVYAWFGQKVRWGGIEATRLVPVFYQSSQFRVAPQRPCPRAMMGERMVKVIAEVTVEVTVKRI